MKPPNQPQHTLDEALVWTSSLCFTLRKVPPLSRVAWDVKENALENLAFQQKCALGGVDGPAENPSSPRMDSCILHSFDSPSRAHAMADCPQIPVPSFTCLHFKKNRPRMYLADFPSVARTSSFVPFSPHPLPPFLLPC